MVTAALAADIDRRLHERYDGDQSGFGAVRVAELIAIDRAPDSL